MLRFPPCVRDGLMDHFGFYFFLLGGAVTSLGAPENMFDNVWYISRNSFATLGYLVNSRITFHRKVIVFLVCSCCLALVKILAGFARVSLSDSSKQSSHHCYNFACLTTFQKAFGATVSKRGCKELIAALYCSSRRTIFGTFLTAAVTAREGRIRVRRRAGLFKKLHSEEIRSWIIFNFDFK